MAVVLGGVGVRSSSNRIVVLITVVLLAFGASVIETPFAVASTRPAEAPHRGPTFAVRTTTATFVDTSRPTPANGSFTGSASRVLPTLIVYPVRHRGDDMSRSDTGDGIGRFPLIVFSHGFGSNGADYAPLLDQFAAAGFVVAAPTFPLSGHDSPGGPTVSDFVNQPGDVSFVITQMLRLNHDRASPIRGRIDPARIGVAGHSLGAITTLGVAFNSCCHDQRIKAAVSLSGIELPFPNGHFFTGAALPLLLLHGNADQTVPYAASRQIFTDASAPKFLVTLFGAPHTAFRQLDTQTRPEPPWEDVIVRSVTDFFDRYLNHDRNALARLGADAKIPGVAGIEQVLPT